MQLRGKNIFHLKAHELVICALIGLGGQLTPASAQTCGSEYTIKEGETLGQIAARAYGNPAQWTVIFYSNQDRIGTNASLLVPGLSIRLPCIGGAQASPQPAAPQAATQPGNLAATSDTALLISSMVRRIEFLTADGYSPFTGRALENGGMLTNVLTSAMNLIKDDAKGHFDYGISSVNDWAAHLNPLLLTRAFDIGFPWSRPNCENMAELDQSGQFRCQRFFFSDPMYEVVTTLFVRQDSRVKTLRIDELAGTSICKPAGYPVDELDQGGRNWLKDGKVTLIRPPSYDECFRLLANGTADGVDAPELVGRASISSVGLGERVRAVDPPLALTTLHLVISKAHPHARTMLYYVNTGHAKLRESGEYDRIIERHLARYWEAQSAAPNPAMATTPAARTSPAPVSATKELAPAAPPASAAKPAQTSRSKSEEPTKGAQ